MCQCYICGCWWLNCFGVCCGGCHDASLIYSFWLCKPDNMRMLDPQCCHICALDGFGFNFICQGSVCCAPKALREWSKLLTAGKSASSLNSNRTILINNPPPSPIYTQSPRSNQLNITTNSNYSTNISMKSNIGGMQVNSNMGDVNMNANMGGVGMNPNMNVAIANGIAM